MDEKRELYIELIRNWNKEKFVQCFPQDDPIYTIGTILHFVGQMQPEDEIHIICN